MAKSKYPEKIDTSVELPHVRDNILEIGSDVINSIRTAIFQIEKTLGVNPQGSVGNSVSSRISRALDSRGNLKKEALDRANILSGPIIDADVSKVAAIQESKLRLDFPTQLLQDEVSILNRQIGSIIAKVDELNYILSTHVSIEATNRHKAKAITVEAIGSSGSSTSTNSVEESTLQSVLDDIYSSHINYDGIGISEENSSHEANQVFFDSTNITQVTSEDDVQGAIEDIALASFFQAVEHQDLFHTNGALNNCVITRDSSSDFGVEISEETSVSFSMPSSTDSSKVSDVTFGSPISISGVEASKSDILTLGDGITSSNYEIESFTLSSDLSSIESVSIFGSFAEDSSSESVGSMSRNTKTSGNITSLLSTAREVPDLTSSSYLVQICNPNSSAIITNEIRPAALNALSSVEISVDGGDSVSLDVYNSSFEQQSLDTIVYKINEQIAENSYNFSAYRLDKDNGGSELVIAHNLPSSKDFDYTLEVTGGSLDGMGLSSDSGVVKATYGNKYFIQGYPYQGLSQKIDVYGSDMSFSSGTNYITSIGGDLDFKENKIYSGDLITIINSDDDSGTYVISSVSSEQIVLAEPVSSVGFSGSSTDETRFLIYRNSVSLSSMEFDEIDSSTSGMVLDIFLDSNQEVYLDKRIEYVSHVNTKYQSLVTIVDFSGDDSSIELSMVASINSSGSVQIILDGGDPIVLASDRVYQSIRSGKHNISLKLLIDRVSDILSEISASSTSQLEFSVYVYPPVNKDTNLHISRVSYDNFRGEITGGGSRSYSNDKQTRRIIRTLVSGITGIDDIASSVKEELVYNRFSETRSDGVVFGLEISNVTLDMSTASEIYEFDISAGAAYVSGKRFEVPLIEGFLSGIPSAGGDSVDNFYIALDEYGNIVALPAAGSSGSSPCSSPFGASGFAILGSVEKSGGVVTGYDLRLLISDLDSKVLNAISVSPLPGMGHFRDISKAIKYAKRFSDIYPGAGVPTIRLKSGVHTIVYDVGVMFADTSKQQVFDKAYESGAWINFPVNIVGEGDSTVLDIMRTYVDYPATSDDRKGAGAIKNDGYIHIAGPGLSATTPTADVNTLSNGKVLLKDFSMRLSGIRILDPMISDGDGVSYNSHVVIDNVKFDFSEKTDFGKHNMGIVVANVDSDEDDRVGNITIQNCKFINSLTRLKKWEANKWYYFKYNNNFLDTLGDEQAYPIYQDTQEGDDYDHIMQADRYHYTSSVTSTGISGQGRNGRYSESQFITAIGNVVSGDSGPYWDPKNKVGFGTVIAEANTYIDNLEVPYWLETKGSVSFSDNTDGDETFSSWLDSTFYGDVKAYGDTIIGNSESDSLTVIAKTFFNTKSTKGIGIGVEDFLPHADGGSVVHIHEDTSNRAYVRFTNTTTGKTAADDETAAGVGGPGVLIGMNAGEDAFLGNLSRGKDIRLQTTDDDGNSKSKFRVGGKGWTSMRSGGVDGDKGFTYSSLGDEAAVPLDVRGCRSGGYIASIFNSAEEFNDADLGVYEGSVLLLGVNGYRPSYKSNWIRFTAQDGKNNPSIERADTVGGVRGTLGTVGNDGVDIKAAFFNFCHTEQVPVGNTPVDGSGSPLGPVFKHLARVKGTLGGMVDYVYTTAPAIDTPRWRATGDDDSDTGETLSDRTKWLNPTTRPHPMIILGGNSANDYNNGHSHYYSKAYGGRGVQYYTGAQDFGEWLKIGDINEWPEILEKELEKDDDDSDIVIINREIFGLEEGMVVYIREAIIYRSGPGTPMVITNRAALVGNASWKDDGYSGEVVSFVGQVPVVVRGGSKDGDYLIPEENHCIPISRDDITFEQYRRVIGTAWRTVNIPEEDDGEFVKVLCAIGIK